MTRALRRAVLVSLVAAAFLPRTLRADDAPSLDAAFDAVRADIEGRKWQEGADALRALLAARAEDPDLRPRLAEAEDLLRRCLFGLTGWALDPVAALGRGAVKFSPGSRSVEFETGPACAGWTRRADLSRTFDVRFEGDVTVEMSWADAANWAVLLAWDPVVRTGLFFEVRPPDHSGGAGRIVRTDEDKEAKDLAVIAAPRSKVAPTSVRVKRAGSMVVVYADRTQVAEAVYVGPRRGLVGLRPAPDVTDGDALPVLHVTGRLDERFAKKVLAGAEAAAFRAWSATGYRREVALPRWVLDFERTSGAWAALLPAGSGAPPVPEVPASAHDALRAAIRAFFEGDDAAFVAREDELGSVVLPENERVLVEAMVACERESFATAETKFRELLHDDPKSVIAAAALAVCALRRGAESEAVTLAAAAREIDAAYAPAYDVAAVVAFRAGDLFAMQAALDDAARNRTASRRTTELRAALRRIRRGPPWARRVDVSAGRVTVAADGDRASCAAIAKIVEATVADYETQFRVLPQATHFRVVVFADDAPWLAWGEDRGLDVDGLAAAYDPTLREIALRTGDDAATRFVPGGDAYGELRSVTFRACLHREVEDVPVWLDVGGARWFSEAVAAPAGRKGGVAPDTAPSDSAREATLLARFSRRFIPYEELCVADRAAFEESADVLGVQSWALVRALRDASDASLRGRLDTYVGALAGGAGRTSAYYRAFAPVVVMIRAAVARHGSGGR